MSDLDANKSIVLRLLEAFNDRQLDLLEDVLHPRVPRARNLSLPPGRRWCRTGARRTLYEGFLEALPDARGDVLDFVAERDKV